MAGLAIGSFVMNRALSRRGRWHLAKLSFAIGLFAAILPLVLTFTTSLRPTGVTSTLTGIAIPLLTLILAILVGMQFPLAGKVDFKTLTTTAAQLYTADYIGACLGALLVSTLLMPVIGVFGVCLLIAVLNCASGGILLFTAKA